MDYLRWNPPMASNMGGVWESQICSARNILNYSLRTHWESLNDELLRTLLIEVEGILNLMPIKCEFIGDVNSYLPLSPMRLLTMKTKVVMPPPWIFQKEDQYCWKQWRCVQHLWWVLDKMEKGIVCNTASLTEVESGKKKLSSWRYCFGMWRHYLKYMANGTNFENLYH